MRYSLTCLLAISLTVSYGQSFVYPVIKTKGKSFPDFAPAGWIIRDSAIGDMNKDGLYDAAIVLQHKDSIPLVNEQEDTVLTQPRILLILFQQAAGSFELVQQSNSFILKHDDPYMDDPYQGISLIKGVLEIKFYIFYSRGSWFVTSADYKFRYQQGQFVLIEANNSSFHRASHDFEDCSYNFLTKKRSLTKGNETKGTQKTTRKTVYIAPLKTLTTFTAPFTWEVEKDIFL